MLSLRTTGESERGGLMLKLCWLWSQMLTILRGARDVELASYCMDEDALFTQLERGLDSSLNLNLYIDREQFAGTIPKKQKAAIRKLFKKGAKIFICKVAKGPSTRRRWWLTAECSTWEAQILQTGAITIARPCSEPLVR